MSDKSYLQALQEAAFWSEYHRKRRDNPHAVTAEQLEGLGDVEALLPAVEAHLTDTDNPHEITADLLGITGGGNGGGGRVNLKAYHPVWYRADYILVGGFGSGW